jgi:hypothetical protein
MQIEIKIEGPILPGSVSTVKSRCGKPRCACKSNKQKLHGPYYQWTGIIDGKRTTRTITLEEARECKKRIARYKKLRKKINAILEKSLSCAPWV